MGEKDGTQGGRPDGQERHEKDEESARLSTLLRLPDGDDVVDLASFDARGTPAWQDGKTAGLAAIADMREDLADLQERLWAASTAGDRRRVLLILQGMDTSGKGGTVKHVAGMFDPAGCRVRAFKAPTHEESKHSFLWRIRRALPEAGEIGIFDRSHYEDVLVARVRGLAPQKEITRRYREINRFEESLADDGVTVLKCFLHISYDQQRRRLLRRLDNPAKHWKFSAGDIEDRALWPEYRKAYEIALERCSTPRAPWFVVPADRRWYRNWAIGTLLLEHLEALDPRYPKADFDVTEYRKLLLKSV
ncbi:PPK2 family polyphosphate kinase [Streptomyces fagopyri]|uniref:PPK2 family polyphosphate kinase n=1 Tax=Streptomyces fagopyri TaxID=2662397 RepID=UPI00380CD71C